MCTPGWQELIELTLKQNTDAYPCINTVKVAVCYYKPTGTAHVHYFSMNELTHTAHFFVINRFVRRIIIENDQLVTGLTHATTSLVDDQP